MKKILINLLIVLVISTPVLGGDLLVKKSNSGICHIPGSHYYNQTKHFTPFKTLDDCLKSGGRLPKR